MHYSILYLPSLLAAIVAAVPVGYGHGYDVYDTGYDGYDTGYEYPLFAKHRNNKNEVEENKAPPQKKHHYYTPSTPMYHPNAPSSQSYYPYMKPKFVNAPYAYDKQQEYDAAYYSSESDNDNANANGNLAGAKSENANENANLAKGGEAFGFGAIESDNRNLLANENNIEVANANKNELGVEVANFNANDNTAQQESAALAEVQSEDLAFFEDFIQHETDNLNANENVNDNWDHKKSHKKCTHCGSDN